MGSGAVALAALVLTLSLPKAAHAIAATAVQVMNTSSTPAITEGVSKLASQSVGLLCYAGYPCYSRSAPCCSTYQVPAGHNLVITDLEALTSTGSGCTVGISLRPRRSATTGLCHKTERCEHGHNVPLSHPVAG